MAAKVEARSFVVLCHEGYGATHYDVMLDMDGAGPLATWRVLLEPASWGDWVPAERLPDHRRVYLTYEGEISDNRGRVRRVDAGTFVVEQRDELAWQLRMKGRLIQGLFWMGDRAARASLQA